MKHTLDKAPQLKYNIRMNTEPHMISLPVNVAHLMSLAGFLQEFATKDQHYVFSSQLAHQAMIQGIDVTSSTVTYDSFNKKTMEFQVPSNCIADVGDMLMATHEDPSTRDDIKSAILFLIGVWAPFAAAALESWGEGNSRLNLGPESLN
jgi:hypothetical protein